MTPPLAKKIGVLKFLDKPVDFNKTLNGKPLLGSHKTWRGVVSGMIMGVSFVYFQALLYQFPQIREVCLINY